MSYNVFHFFLGSNSPRGFYSKMSHLAQKFNCNVIKGCSGCGKSTLMRKIFDKAKNVTDVELIHCSSDPDSLDAIILKDKNVCFVDGTSPHILEPNLPGIFGDIVNLCKFKNSLNSTKYKREIIKLDNEYKKIQFRAQKYLMSFGAVFSDTLESVIEKINFDKIEKLAVNLEKKIFTKKLSKTPNKQVRFLRSVGPKGVVSFLDDLSNFYKIYEINDNFFIITDILLNHIKKVSLKNGYDTIICLSPLTLNERIEALIIPELKISFVLTDRFYDKMTKIKTKKIDISGCYDCNIKESKYNSKVEMSLVQESIKCMKSAKKIHDKIEIFYKNIIDFDAINDISNRIIEKIFI